jgi:hypothetical protein
VERVTQETIRNYNESKNNPEAGRRTGRRECEQRSLDRLESGNSNQEAIIIYLKKSKISL